MQREQQRRLRRCKVVRQRQKEGALTATRLERHVEARARRQRAGGAAAHAWRGRGRGRLGGDWPMARQQVQRRNEQKAAGARQAAGDHFQSSRSLGRADRKRVLRQRPENPGNQGYAKVVSSGRAKKAESRRKEPQQRGRSGAECQAGPGLGGPSRSFRLHAIKCDWDPQAPSQAPSRAAPSRKG